MRSLLSLNPKWLGVLRPESGEGLGFDCPVCGPSHTLVAYFTNPLDGGQVMPGESAKWRRGGTHFQNLTIQPSIQYDCFHGWVEKGRVFDISEAPLTVMGKNQDGRVGPYSLSPIQAMEVARLTLKRAKKLLEGPIPPPVQSPPEQPCD